MAGGRHRGFKPERQHWRSNATMRTGAAGLPGSSNFDQQCIEAEIGAADDLEQAAYERAVIGWEEPVYHRGELVGQIRKFSDSLLLTLLKGAKPEKYRDTAKVAVTIGDDIMQRLNAGRARVGLCIG